jgi:trehalose synthase
MIEEIEVKRYPTLDDYAALAHLSEAVAELRREAARTAPTLGGRTLWMVNSTARGGGVAEMLPRDVALLEELGVRTRWLVISTHNSEFFALTKRIHNLIHDSGDAAFSAEERALYDRVSRELAAELRARVAPGDVLVVHDPQPAGAGALVKAQIGVVAVWRCHIGLDVHTPATQAAWSFLEPYVTRYDHAVFSAPEYVPGTLADKTSIISPSIDPFTHKNRDLSTHKIVGILADARLIPGYGPVLAPPFGVPATRLQTDGSQRCATEPEDIGLLFRPIVTQVSRWDRLKGWRPLLDGFVLLKRRLAERAPPPDDRVRRTLELVRLVLAGPDPASIQDDPEAVQVFEQIREAYRSLEPELQRDIALLSLPMASLKENALMVNVLQRCSTIVAQNSLQEGFGLTATEAMWKRIAVVASPACGLRQQIRPGIDGKMFSSAENRGEIADVLEALLSNPREREALGRSAQRRVHDEFLIFSALRRWLTLLAAVVTPSGNAPAAASTPTPP